MVTTEDGRNLQRNSKHLLPSSEHFDTQNRSQGTEESNNDTEVQTLPTASQQSAVRTAVTPSNLSAAEPHVTLRQQEHCTGIPVCTSARLKYIKQIPCACKSGILAHSVKKGGVSGYVITGRI